MCAFFVVIALATSHWSIAAAAAGVTIVMMSVARALQGRAPSVETLSPGGPRAQL